MKLLDRYETVADVGFDESPLLFEGGGIFVRRLGVMALQGEGLAWGPRRLVHGQHWVGTRPLSQQFSTKAG